MAQIQGGRFTTHQSTETRAMRDVKSEVNQLEPDKSPLTAILNKANGKLKITGNYKYEWFEDSLLPRFDVLGSTALTSSASSMIVTNYAYFRKGDLVRVNKSETVFVSATPSATTVSIRRAYGGTASAAAAGSQLHIIANISDEGDTVGDILTTQKVPQYNYTHNFRTPYKVSGSAQASEVYGKSDLDFEKAKCVIEHCKSLELANILGVRHLDTTNETRMSTYNGVLEFISTNSKDAGGTLTEDELEDFLRLISRYGSKTKILFGSSKLMTVINGFGRDKLQMVPSEKTYGVSLTQYMNAGRKIMLNEHPLLENDSQTDLTGLAGTGIALDIGDLSFRHLKGRYMSISEVGPRKDSTLTDGTVGDILTEGGLQLEQEKKHGELTGVTD